jgi:hypothetical protein
MRHDRSLLSCLLLAAELLAPEVAVHAAVPAAAQAAKASAGGDPAAHAALEALLDEALGEQRASAPAGGRALFAEVLKSPLFVSRAVGPFDLSVCVVDGLGKPRQAQALLDDAAAGLAKVVPVMERHFGREQGLVSGHRFPIVLAKSDRARGEQGYAQLVALVDHCEDGDFSGWKPANAVWTAANLEADVLRTWEVQVFNLAHASIATRLDEWCAHGLGYHALAHVANRLMRLGSWGMVPPWLAQGLIDELDIEAYGEAWVGGDWWTSQTPGWFRPGWSGFVPEGHQPPRPVTGPPADLAVKVQKTGDSWEHRASSRTRHWSELAADRRSAAPASFAFMARNESFLPRDRAYARCALNLLIDVAPGDVALPALLDREALTPPSGMPDSDPLTVVVARALGGVPAVDELERMPGAAMLATLGRDDVARRVAALGGAGLLELADHREQARWLYGRSMDMAVRTQLFHLIMEAEYHQQLREWELIGEHLDAAAAAALAATARYPASGRDRSKVIDAFHRKPGEATRR